jgi:hypothetical protein
VAFTVTRVITAVCERKDAERFLDAVRAGDPDLAERLRLARVDLDDERATSNPALRRVTLPFGGEP